MRLIGAIAALAAICATLSAPARADDSLEAKRRFDRARELMTIGAFEQACPLLEESHALVPRLGTLINLAACYERLGRTATAWQTYTEAREQAHDEQQLDRERFAQERIKVLRPRVPWLTVTVANRTAAQLAIALDGVPLNLNRWGERLPIDPGDHVLVAAAPGHQPYQQRFTIAEAQQRTIVVTELQTLEPAPPAPTTTSPPAPSEVVVPALEEDDSGWMLELGLFGGYLYLSPGVVNPSDAFGGRKEAMGGGAAGLQLLAGYRFSSSLNLVGRGLLGPRFGGGLVAGLGPALQLRVADRVWLGFGGLIGGGNYSVERETVGDVTGTVGIALGPQL